jgi:hypothetical protein
MLFNPTPSRQERSCCFPDRGNQQAKASRARPQRRFSADSWNPLQDIAELGSEPTDQDIETFDHLIERDRAIYEAERRLVANANTATAAAKADSKQMLGTLVVEINNDTIQIDRTHRTTPPAAVGLPRQIVHVALSSRLLPAPIATAALARARLGGGILN